VAATCPREPDYSESMAADPDCIFCRIVAGDLPAEVVHSTGTSVAFRDLDPQAPTHVVVVPREHHDNAAASAAHDPASLGDLVTVAAAVADAEGLDGAYRMVLNTGAEAGQSVFHTHLHLLGGRPMRWPPG
jgi:histidine triad (HIT) family protein